MPLFVVATPIGNLGDITARALEVLRDSDVVACEDTRRTRALLTHFGLSKPLVSLPAFDEDNRAGPLLARLSRGDKVALVTDAGTPAISDPGAILVRRAAAAGVEIVPIPGASAVAAAVSASGLAADRFVFLGFLPRSGAGRAETLARAAATGFALVIYEAPGRVGATLGDLLEALGDRRALVARELTKLHEELARGTLSELAARFSGEVRGEVVIVVDAGEPPAVKDAAPVVPLEDALRARLATGESAKDASRALAQERGLSRREVYQLALGLLGK